MTLGSVQFGEAEVCRNNQRSSGLKRRKKKILLIINLIKTWMWITDEIFSGFVLLSSRSKRQHLTFLNPRMETVCEERGGFH